LINLSGVTLINGVSYNEYSTTTFTANTDSFGQGNFSVITSATTTTIGLGQKVIWIEITNSSAGSQIPTGTTTNILWYIAVAPLASAGYLGGTIFSATTSGDACNNISYETIYKTSSLNPVVGQYVYSGTSGTSIINGDDKWLSVVKSPSPYDGLLSYNTKYAIKVNASGMITNVQTCP